MAPVIFWVIFWVFHVVFTKIYNKLVPVVKNKEDFTMEIRDIVDPFEEYDIIVQPPYLDMPEMDQDMESFERDRQNERNVRRANGEVKRNKEKANRHQKLFCCGKWGLDFNLYIFQLWYLLSIFWFSAFIASEGWMAHKVYQNYTTSWNLAVAFTVICPFLMFVFWFIIIPSTLQKFTIISHTQMMKDKEIIKKVISHQKFYRSRRSRRMYQVFKLIRRELMRELKQDTEDDEIKDNSVVKKLLVENFKIFGASFDQKNRRKRHQYHGQTLWNKHGDPRNLPFHEEVQQRKDELIYLSRKEKRSSTETSSELWSKLLNDVKIDIYEVVKEILGLYVNLKEEVSITELK